MAGRKVYQTTNVLEQAEKRIAAMFDEFRNIVVSVSGGKDSTVLYELARKEAVKRGRVLNLFFLDQEAEYQSTIDIMEHMMSQEGVAPHWYQVPIQMTNSTSFDQPMLNAWYDGEEWMRAKHPLAIHNIDVKYSARFYSFIQWFNARWDARDTVHLVGLRAEESLNRLRAVIKNPGHNGYKWTTATKGHITAYPLYDWTFEDVWHHIYKEGIRYNGLYDFLYAKGFDIQEARVSNLVHESSFKCITHLQEFEPETYERLLKRIPSGAHVAARYAKDKSVYSNKELPKNFRTYLEYRDFLLSTLPESDMKNRLITRFAKQSADEHTYKQHVRQVLIFDWENNIPVTKKKESNTAQKWRELL